MARSHEYAGKAMGKTKEMGSKLRGEVGIFQRLRKEHGEVSGMMMSCKAMQNPEKRAEVFHTIRQELLSHAKGEQQEFYSVLRNHEKTRGIIEESLEEHDEVESLVQNLTGLPTDDPTWGDRLSELIEKVQHHVHEEETDLFPRAQEVLSDQDAKDIEERYLQAKKEYIQRIQ